MKINFECKGCKKEFDCEMGTIGINEATMRPNFEKLIACPHCGEKTMDEVLLTELGQSQLTEATMYLWVTEGSLTTIMKNKNKFIEEYDSHHSNFFDDPDDKYHEAVCQSMDDVNEALEGADVDTDDRRIIWKDGVRLTVDESANRIKKQSNVDIEHIKRGILTWLEMEFVPADMNEKQMEIFEEKISNWIKNHDKERINPKDIVGNLFIYHDK